MLSLGALVWGPAGVLEFSFSRSRSVGWVAAGGSEKWPARQPAAGTGPGSRAGPREEGAGATDEREVAPAAWGGGRGGPAR